MLEACAPCGGSYQGVINSAVYKTNKWIESLPVPGPALSAEQEPRRERGTQVEGTAWPPWSLESRGHIPEAVQTYSKGFVFYPGAGVLRTIVGPFFRNS